VDARSVLSNANREESQRSLIGHGLQAPGCQWPLVPLGGTAPPYRQRALSGSAPDPGVSATGAGLAASLGAIADPEVSPGPGHLPCSRLGLFLRRSRGLDLDPSLVVIGNDLSSHTVCTLSRQDRNCKVCCQTYLVPILPSQAHSRVGSRLPLPRRLPDEAE